MRKQRRSLKKRFSFRASAPAACLFVLLVLVIGVAGNVRSNAIHENSETPSRAPSRSIEIRGADDLAMSESSPRVLVHIPSFNERIEPDARFALAFTSDSGAVVPVVSDAILRDTTPPGISMALTEALILKALEQYGSIVSIPIPKGQQSPFSGKTVGSLADAREIIVSGRKLDTPVRDPSQPQANASRMWMIGEPEMHFVERNGTIRTERGSK